MDADEDFSVDVDYVAWLQQHDSAFRKMWIPGTVLREVGETNVKHEVATESHDIHVASEVVRTPTSTGGSAMDVEKGVTNSLAMASADEKTTDTSMALCSEAPVDADEDFSADVDNVVWLQQHDSTFRRLWIPGTMLTEVGEAIWQYELATESDEDLLVTSEVVRTQMSSGGLALEAETGMITNTDASACFQAPEAVEGDFSVDFDYVAWLQEHDAAFQRMWLPGTVLKEVGEASVKRELATEVDEDFLVNTEVTRTPIRQTFSSESGGGAVSSKCLESKVPLVTSQRCRCEERTVKDLIIVDALAAEALEKRAIEYERKAEERLKKRIEVMASLSFLRGMGAIVTCPGEIASVMESCAVWAEELEESYLEKALFASDLRIQARLAMTRKLQGIAWKIRNDKRRTRRLEKRAREYERKGAERFAKKIEDMASLSFLRGMGTLVTCAGETSSEIALKSRPVRNESLDASFWESCASTSELTTKGELATDGRRIPTSMPARETQQYSMYKVEPLHGVVTPEFTKGVLESWKLDLWAAGRNDVAHKTDAEYNGRICRRLLSRSASGQLPHVSFLLPAARRMRMPTSRATGAAKMREIHKLVPIKESKQDDCVELPVVATADDTGENRLHKTTAVHAWEYSGDRCNAGTHETTRQYCLMPACRFSDSPVFTLRGGGKGFSDDALACRPREPLDDVSPGIEEPVIVETTSETEFARQMYTVTAADVECGAVIVGGTIGVLLLGEHADNDALPSAFTQMLGHMHVSVETVGDSACGPHSMFGRPTQFGSLGCVGGLAGARQLASQLLRPDFASLQDRMQMWAPFE